MERRLQPAPSADRRTKRVALICSGARSQLSRGFESSRFNLWMSAENESRRIARASLSHAARSPPLAASDSWSFLRASNLGSVDGGSCSFLLVISVVRWGWTGRLVQVRLLDSLLQLLSELEDLGDRLDLAVHAAGTGVDGETSILIWFCRYPDPRRLSSDRVVGCGFAFEPPSVE